MYHNPPRRARPMKMRSRQNWQNTAEIRLSRILVEARSFPTLARRGPKSSWSVSLQIVGASPMSQLNSQYRGKNYPTDILSFPAPPVFRETGLLGELIICLPTLRRQAKEFGHSELFELEVLTVHGVLHLLGLDHEK